MNDYVLELFAYDQRTQILYGELVLVQLNLAESVGWSIRRRVAARFSRTVRFAKRMVYLIVGLWSGLFALVLLQLWIITFYVLSDIVQVLYFYVEVGHEIGRTVKAPYIQIGVVECPAGHYFFIVDE